MTTPNKPIWARDPHTAAKHQIIQRYLQALFPILLINTGLKSITYAEGFAGPGAYEGGEPGSPVIAYAEATRVLRDRPAKRVNFVLVEEQADRLSILQEQMAKAGDPNPQAPTTYGRGTCATTLLKTLEETGAFNGPIFALLDSWGSPVIPHDLLPRIAATQSSEVLITFQPAFLARYGTVPQHQAAGDRAFGGEHWHSVFSLPSNQKYAYLVDAYRTSVKNAGFAYILSFELVDEQGHELHLLFGTNSTKGLEKMKDAMWKVDPIRGVHYRDPRDLDQEQLEMTPEPGIGPLRRLIHTHLATLGNTFTLGALQQFALLETVYRPPHATAVVRALIQESIITRLDRGPLSLSSTLRLAPPKPKPSQASQEALF